MNIDELKGAKLLQVWHDDDLYFRTDRGNFRFPACGDCCAYAFVSSVAAASSVLGGEILGLEEKEGPSGHGEHDAFRNTTFYTFLTSKGRMDVTLHVDHSGYYGGWLGNPRIVAAVPPHAQIPED